MTLKEYMTQQTKEKIMTKKYLKLKALEAATKVSHNKKSLKEISEEIYQWLIKE